jgi:hypothetical protein
MMLYYQMRGDEQNEKQPEQVYVVPDEVELFLDKFEELADLP